MPMAPRVSDTQSRETIMQSSAKLSVTMANAWRESRSDEYPMPSPIRPASTPPASAPLHRDQCSSVTSSAAV